jgi:MerR family copper efflux transcriptional regulator
VALVPSDGLLRIGEVASAAGVSTRTVDFYTSLGLVEPAARSAGNYRLYEPVAAERIALIQRLEGHGIGLDDIAAALRGEAGSAPRRLEDLQRDLPVLQAAVQHAGDDAHGLLAAVTARAHALISTALDIAAGLPPAPL